MNKGAIPINFDSDVGRWRLLTGDVDYEPIPNDSEHGNFELWSDAEIQAYIDSFGEDSIERAIGMAYLAWASRLAEEAELIKTYDLQVDTRARADAMLKIANRWLQRADDIDDAGGLNEAVIMIPMTHRERFVPEASPRWVRGL